MTDKTTLQIALLRKGMTLGDLSDKIGISRASLSYKVNNKRLFTSTEIKNISEQLELSSTERDQIFFGIKADKTSAK